MPPQSQPPENEIPAADLTGTKGVLKVSYNEGATNRDPVFVQEFVMSLYDLKMNTDQNGTVAIFISGKIG